MQRFKNFAIDYVISRDNYIEVIDIRQICF